MSEKAGMIAMAERPDELTEYRPVSPLAVAALVAGLGSVLVLFTPLAAMLPLVAIALAVVALADIGRSEGRKVGRWAAVMGLALAVGFVCQAVATAWADHMIARGRAVATATTWLDAVRTGQLADALAVSGPLILPAARGDHDGGEQGPESRLSAFGELPAVRAVAACEGVIPAVVGSERAAAAWLIQVSLAGCPGADELRIVVEPQLTGSPRGPVERWLVIDVTVEAR